MSFLLVEFHRAADRAARVGTGGFLHIITDWNDEESMTSSELLLIFFIISVHIFQIH